MALSPLVSTTDPTALAACLRDPILAAIDLHDEARAVLRSVPAVASSDLAGRAALDALLCLLGTPCATREGAEILLRHLRQHIEAGRLGADPLDLSACLVVARAADLSLLLGLPGASAPLRLPAARAATVRTLNRGFEVAAGFAIVIGGGLLVGFASLL